MNADRPCELEVVQVVLAVLHAPRFEGDGDRGVAWVDLFDNADVSVEDLQIVVVASLHHLLAEVESVASDGDMGAVAAELFLNRGVDRLVAEVASVRGCKDLDVLQRVEAKGLWHALGDDLNDGFECLFGVIASNEEVLPVRLLLDAWESTFADFVRGDDDGGGVALPEDAVEVRRGDRSAADEIREDFAGADGWELVRIPDKDELSARTDGAE